jgi:hypothetical protein
MHFTLPYILLAAISAYAAPTAHTSIISNVEKRQGDVGWLIKSCIDERGGGVKMWDCSKSKVYHPVDSQMQGNELTLVGYICDISGMCWGVCKFRSILWSVWEF